MDLLTIAIIGFIAGFIAAAIRDFIKRRKP